MRKFRIRTTLEAQTMKYRTDDVQTGELLKNFQRCRLIDIQPCEFDGNETCPQLKILTMIGGVACRMRAAVISSTLLWLHNSTGVSNLPRIVQRCHLEGKKGKRARCSHRRFQNNSETLLLFDISHPAVTSAHGICFVFF